MALEDSWTLRTSATDSQWRAVTWSPELSLFCAVAWVGTGNRVMTSPDGITWTGRTSAAQGWLGVIWVSDLSLFIAFSNATSGSDVMTSPDGITWTIRTSVVNSGWYTAAWSPELSLICAVSASGTGNQVMTSPDGITWTVRVTPSPSHPWVNIVWAPELSLFCAVESGGSANGIMTSPDGLNWTARVTTTTRWFGLDWSPELGLFCSLGFVAGVGEVTTSPDGITWTARTIPHTAEVYGLKWCPELSLFCSPTYTTSEVLTSPDGITWTAGTATNGDNWLGIPAWSPELSAFCCISQIGSTSSVMTWNFQSFAVTITETLAAVKFIASAVSVKFKKFIGKITTSTGTANVPALHNEPCYVTVSADQGEHWEASKTYAVGDRCFPLNTRTIPYCFQVSAITTGVAGSTEPLFPSTIGDTIVDSGVTWENVWQLVGPVMHGPLNPS